MEPVQFLVPVVPGDWRKRLLVLESIGHVVIGNIAVGRDMLWIMNELVGRLLVGVSTGVEVGCSMVRLTIDKGSGRAGGTDDMRERGQDRGAEADILSSLGSKFFGVT